MHLIRSIGHLFGSQEVNTLLVEMGMNIQIDMIDQLSCSFSLDVLRLYRSVAINMHSVCLWRQLIFSTLFN